LNELSRVFSANYELLNEHKVNIYYFLLLTEMLKGVLNPNFRSFSFELEKNKFFKINFDLGRRAGRLIVDAEQSFVLYSEKRLTCAKT